MTQPQLTLLLIVAATIAMFLWGRWRHDMVALGALLASVFLGIVPGADAFAGFGHPAVITVAAVLVLGYGLQVTGAVDLLTQKLLPSNAGIIPSILALTGIAALLSGFMNNVGALALLMPVAIQIAGKQGLPPGKILMPLAFASLLGGMTTLIGTPPNLIVSGFRESTGAVPFNMFDFAPVGVVVAVIGVLFIGIVGWRLVPARKRSDTSSFESGSYMSEIRISATSKALDKQVREVEEMLDEVDAQIVAIVRRDVHLSAPNPRRYLREGDILVVEIEPESLATALAVLGDKLADDVPSPKPVAPAMPADGGKPAAAESADARTAEKPVVTSGAEVVIQEWVVTASSDLIGRSSSDIELRTRYGINLLALSRQGERMIKRLRSIEIAAGDVLLVQGPVEVLGTLAVDFGCLPLAKRDLRLPRKGKALTASLLMLGAVIATASGLLPASVAFATGALAFVALNVVPIRSVYDAIDWSVIVLLAALLPVADAIGSTGAADLLARMLLESVAHGNPTVALVVVLVVTMFLSDVMNNAATAAVMCPIGISTAAQLGVNSDPFLMAIAVGASCAFLTPIGHQSNTLILGPGGFQFGDYWRLGIVLEVMVVAVGVPMILWVWPL